jgi:hypothetical protein
MAVSHLFGETESSTSWILYFLAGEKVEEGARELSR